jgi:hypothetical protein
MNPDISITPDTLSDNWLKVRRDSVSWQPESVLKMKITSGLMQVSFVPDFLSPLRMAVIRSLTQAYDKEKITAPFHADWASGAFLVFDARHCKRRRPMIAILCILKMSIFAIARI